jgi:hypothetical protein
MNQNLTLFLPISREWVLKRWYSNLMNLSFPHSWTRVVIFIDSDDMFFRNLVKDLIGELQRSYPFKSVDYIYGNKPAPEDNIIARRMRIREMWTRAIAKFEDNGILVSIEDDTLCHKNAIKGFLADLGSDPELGFISGVQAHRHANKPIGAWKISDDLVHTIPTRTQVKETEEVDGAGLYCFAAPMELVKRITPREDGPPFGPDVCFVQDITKMGFKAKIKWNVPCGHMLEDGSTIMPKDSEGIVGFKRINGEWELYYESDTGQH